MASAPSTRSSASGDRLRNARALDSLRDPGRAKVRAVRDPRPAPRLRMVFEDDPTPAAERTSALRDADLRRPHGDTVPAHRPALPRFSPANAPTAPEAALPPPPGLLAAIRCATPRGVVHVVRTEHDPGVQHGADTLGRWLDRADIRAGTLALDLETTGLSAARGAVLAMAGIAFIGPDGQVVVEQSLLLHPAEEAAGLAWLGRRLAQAPLVWTWNGQRFDMPFIAARASACGVDVPAPPHEDQYLLERRSGRPGRLRLTDVEERVLGLQRTDDLPGAEAPARFAELYASGRLDAVAPVLEHNRLDVISTLLLGGLAERMRTPD